MLLNISMLTRSLNYQIRRTRGPLLALALVGYFSYHMIQGNHGILAWKTMDIKLVEAKNKLASLQQSQQQLEKRVSLLRPSSLCTDLLEQQARKILGFTRPGEIVVIHPSYSAVSPSPKGEQASS